MPKDTHGTPRTSARLRHLVACATVLVNAACSEADSGSTIDGAGDGQGTGGVAGTPSDTPFSSGGGGGGSSIVGELEDPTCVQDVATADVVPVDIYMMFDQSRSMNEPAGLGSRLDAVRAAIADFVRDDKSEGIGMGIGYFGYQPRGETTCVAADYATPDVPIAPLPGVSNALLSSLTAIDPVGETPTGAALRGACEYATTHHAENPDHVVAILLVTDGEPEAPTTVDSGGTCNPTLADAMSAASECATDAGIVTYVLGVGNALTNLNAIADSGGTLSAQLVEGGDVTNQVLLALRSIRGDVVPCEFTIPEPPDGERLDYATVNVEFTAGDGTSETLVNVPSPTECGDGGWFYDDGREHILLCPTTCDRVSTDPAGSLDYALGCIETLTLR